MHTEEDLFDALKQYLASMTCSDRQVFFEKLADRYCLHCGRELVSDLDFCQCTNDD